MVPLMCETTRLTKRRRTRLRFTILSHAGLCVEHNGVRIVSDPWLIGSCYWRSWWNFPEPPADLISDLKPDYIYLTHLHWDHFHGASLKKLFDPATPILVPKVNTRRMLDDLHWLGFHNITEIPHGESMRLGNDFTLASYQFNLLGTDSAMVLSGGDRCILNSNDCKHFGWPLRQITNKHPKIDFVLRSHSSAAAIPYCIDGYKEMFPDVRSQQNYIEEFSRFALHIGARYAVPFASNHCFLHRETIRFNDTAVLPDDIPSYYQRLAAKANVRSECIVMAPGSSWSDDEGFRVIPFDYARREEQIAGMLAKHGEALVAQYAAEDAAVADFSLFRTYFLGLIGSIPWVIRQWLKTRVVFRTHDARGEHNWLVDMASGKVEETAAAADETVIEVAALVLNDCAKVRMFSVWTASKRLRIQLPSRERLKSLVMFFQILDMYELDFLPLRRNLSLRALTVSFRRWREYIEMAGIVLKHVVFRRPIDIAALYTLPTAQND
jgi:UDP-MurNAc hydroxylase